ncbi:MAG: lipopolysaccharide biosynthesis protein [Oscillospiraceae bacterium]
MKENLKRNFFWNTLGSLSYYAAQWAISMLVLRLVGIEQSGLFTTAFTVTNTFITLASYGMRTYQVADLQGKHSFRAYLYSRLFSCTAASILCILLMFVINYSMQQRIVIILCLAYRITEPISDVLEGECQKAGRLDIGGKSYVLRSFTTILPFFTGIIIFKSISFTLAIMAILSWAVVIIYDIPRCMHYKKDAGERKVIPLLYICAPLALYAVLGTASASIPKFFLERVLGSDKLGIYGPVTAPVLVLQMGATYLFTPLISIFSQYYAQRDTAAFKRLTLRIGIIITAMLPIGLLGAALVGEWGLATFVSVKYVKYEYLLQPMVVSAVLTALVLYASMLLTILDARKGLVISNLLGIITAALICAPLLKIFDMQGATYAAILALCVQLIGMIIFGIKSAKQYFSIKEIKPEGC